MSQWLTGKAAPRPERLAELKRVLRLPHDTLARHLGYVPSDQSERKPVMTVVEAAEADPRLGEREQRILAAVYRELVQQAAEDGGQRAAG